MGGVNKAPPYLYMKDEIYIVDHTKESRKDLFYDAAYLSKFESVVLKAPIQQIYDDLYELETGTKLIYRRY